MVQLTPQSRILLATEPVDFRKGMDGLAAVCRQVLGDSPLRGGLCLPQPPRHSAQAAVL